MSGIFEAYDQEFNALSREISNASNTFRDTESASKRDVQAKQIDGLFSQVTELIKQMEVEVRSLDPATRKTLSEKMAQYKRAVASLKTDFNSRRNQADSSALMGGKSAADRQRLLDTNEKIARQNDMIANATKTVAETEDVGLEITTELARNRQKIESSQAKASEFTGMTDVARRMLGSMQRRDTRQKWIMGFVATVLVIAIALTVYFSSAKKKN